AQYCVQALQAVPGIREVHRNVPPSMGSEDFSFMLEQVPGAYIWVGNGEDSAPLHNPRYDFNDALLPSGVQYWLSLVHVLLGAEANDGETTNCFNYPPQNNLHTTARWLLVPRQMIFQDASRARGVAFGRPRH